MPRKFIADLHPGDTVQDVFLVRDKQLRTQRDGAFYMDMELADRTGVAPSKFWNATRELFEAFAPDDFVLVKARAESYRGKLQLVVTDVRRVEAASVDIAEFLPSTTKNVGQLMARVREIVKGTQDARLKALLEAFLADPEFVRGFQRAPAGVSIHHACLGGLLEHTVAVANLALRLADAYPNLNRDLLAAGALLHDIGKVESFEFERGFRYSDAGGLIGHLNIGASLIERKAAGIEGFPRPLLEQLLHLILSHHGAYEFGSPILPATAEAVALHYLDNLDAKLAAFETALLADVDEQANWTEWSRVFDRRLYKKRV
ncbi:MAG TPA: HD domain-containing protein [Planctomycetota bacterium]|nr:HD domain-containing protein [Planctomycetota bacterium]